MTISSPVDVVVGEYYDVPCIKVDAIRIGYIPGLVDYDCIPVLHPAHDVGPVDCLNPVPRHFHMDYRFIDQKIFYVQSSTFVFVGDDEAFTRRLRCLQAKSNPTAWIFAIDRLYKRFADHQLKDRICPHKGVKITDNYICGVCPAHGLAWDLGTGKLRYKPPFYLALYDEAGNEAARGIIQDGCCKIDINKEFLVAYVKGSQILLMVDDNNEIYPNAFYNLDNDRSFRVGDSIRICDENCGA